MEQRPSRADHGGGGLPAQAAGRGRGSIAVGASRLGEPAERAVEVEGRGCGGLVANSGRPIGTAGLQRLPGTGAPSLIELMRMTREEWDVWTRGSAIRRAGYSGFQRNVAVALGNWLASGDEPPGEAVAALREALEGESELVREHAAWALGRANR